MNADHWARLKELFEEALDRIGSDRAEFLVRSCADDRELFIELKRLLDAHDRAGSFLESPSAEAEALRSGQVLSGRFTVIRLLGRGGMGEVYEAEDTHLKTRVALKTLRIDRNADATSSERLLEEIRQARKVTHENVCRVFDLGTDDTPLGPLLFFTMALLDGETLAARLRRIRPLDVLQARSLGAGMAAALDAAHRAGIVHRDFKCSNVMIVPGPAGRERTVVMDFGLAREALTTTEVESLTETGHLIGTPAYMAPELLRGARATPASDVYAFGIVLREMITSAAQVTSGHFQFDRLAPPWDAVVRRCLDIEPSRRFSSAGEAVAALAPPSFLVKHRWRLALASVLLVALSVSAFRLYYRGVAGADGGGLLLADVENATQDRELDATTEVLQSQLGQSAYFRLWDRTRAPAILKEMNHSPSDPLAGGTARQVAMRENVPLVLFSSIAPLGDGMNLSIRIESLAPASIFTRRSWDYSVHVPAKSQMHESLHDASLWVRRVVGENAAGLAAHDRLPQETTTSSWEALADFAHAEHFQSQRQTSTAIAVLQDALQLDPHFALAAMRLGDLLTSSYRSEEGLSYWRLAQNETTRQRLTRREELRIRGLYASDTQDYPVAESSFAQLEAEYPHDYLASFYLAGALRWQNRLEESIAKLKAADWKQPGSLAVVAGMASNYLLLGQETALNGQIERLRGLHLDLYAAHYQGLRQFAAGEYEQSLQSFRQEGDSPDMSRHRRGVYYQAAVLCELGRLQEARVLVETRLRDEALGGEPELRSNELLTLAYIAWKQDRVASARSLCLEAASDRSGPALVGRAGVLLARSGNLDAARLLHLRLSGFSSTNVLAIAETRLSAEILMAENRPKAALAAFRKLDSLEPALRHREGLARVLFRLGQSSESATHYQRLLAGSALWQTLERDYPGFLTDACLDAARAASAAGLQDQAQHAVSIFAQRRGDQAASRLAKELL